MGGRACLSVRVGYGEVVLQCADIPTELPAHGAAKGLATALRSHVPFFANSQAISCLIGMAGVGMNLEHLSGMAQQML
jgi:hypothetical protein